MFNEHRVAILTLVALFGLLFLQADSKAYQMTNRSVVIGSSNVSVNTYHNFKFDYPTVNNVGSLEFEYCVNSPLVGSPCVPPTGLSVSAATLASQSGEMGFAMDAATTANKIVVSRLPGTTSIGSASYSFTNITNPSSEQTVFVRVSSFSGVGALGPRVDDGTVAFSTAKQVTVSGFVPPYLTFCVGVTVANDCSSANGDFVGFGELSKTGPKSLTSQYAGATNDPTGYSTSVYGITMSSGTNAIPALNSPAVSIPGVSQFGMNLRTNSAPNIGRDPAGAGTSVALADYNQPNMFTFKNQTISKSTTSTDFNVFTVSYLVNVSSSQPAGIYNTTLTYIATASF